jgi:hypothetical protein
MPRLAYVKSARKGETLHANQPETAPIATFGAKVENSLSIIEVEGRENHMDNDHMISKFDRAVAGLQGGHNLAAKATTIEHIDPILGEAETYIIQTVRDQKGDHVIVKFVDKEGVKRLILPPKVTGTIVRQRDALTARGRSNTAKATAKARKDRCELPGFMRKKAAA